MTPSLLWTGLAALTAASLLTPVVAVAMTRLGVTDRPDGRRKLHGREVPLAGGLAVLAAVLAAVFFGEGLGRSGPVAADTLFWRCFLAAACLLSAVGLADDAWRLRGRHKLLGQILAVSLLVGGGLLVRRVSLFGWDVELGVMAVPFTMFWLLGAINAMNLIDGMDGLASTVGGMIGFALCVMASLNGHHAEAALAAALVGGLAGFLIYNLPPAKVFLGDTGSMVVGLVLGVVAVRASMKGPATFAAAAPLAVFTLPVLDVAMAILRRKLTGRSLYATDRGHLHHRLGDRGLSTRKSLLLVVTLCGVTTAGALASVAYGAEWLAPASAAVVVAFLVLTRSFGHSECLLLARRARSFAVSLVPARVPSAGHAGREHRSQLQGTREWDDLWESLVEFGARLGLTSVQLDVSLPSIHEEFFASWKRPAASHEDGSLYRAEIPLRSLQRRIGVLRIEGQAPEGSAVGWIGEVVDGLRPFEAQVADLLFGAADDRDDATGDVTYPAGTGAWGEARVLQPGVVPVFSTSAGGRGRGDTVVL